MADTTPKTELRVIDLTPRRDEATKPAELIHITGHQDLTLNARRTITLLWHHAHLQRIEEGKDYQIEFDELKPQDHHGYECVEEAIEALMRTLITVRMADGRTRRVQFLGGNDLDDPDRAGGVLTFSFDKRLVEILKDSAIWGKISIPVLMAFSSKYSVSLYENIAQKAGLHMKSGQRYTLEKFREILGVQPGRYRTFGELNKHVIKAVVPEINALAGFNISILPVKTGKKVTHIHVGWSAKSTDEIQTAWAEIHKSKVGRRARISGTTEGVSEPMPSLAKLRRNNPFLNEGGG